MKPALFLLAVAVLLAACAAPAAQPASPPAAGHDLPELTVFRSPT
ncbi:MAG TPA: hypothetical protein PKM78_06980 [Anaerolineae bacterium]|nr:hypothetical protein [Anaerolineae bacterium]